MVCPKLIAQHAVAFIVVAIASTPAGVLAQAANPAQGVRAPYSLAITPRSLSVTAGDAVWVDAKITNVSDHAVLVYRAISEDMDQGGWVYGVDVRDEKGKQAPQTKYALSIGVGGSGGYLRLDPGQTMTHSINVSKLYDLSRGHKYTIQLRRLDEETKAFVMSNKATVTVTR
jgi:hypothetical protein